MKRENVKDEVVLEELGWPKQAHPPEAWDSPVLWQMAPILFPPPSSTQDTPLPRINAGSTIQMLPADDLIQVWRALEPLHLIAHPTVQFSQGLTLYNKLIQEAIEVIPTGLYELTPIIQTPCFTGIALEACHCARQQEKAIARGKETLG